MANWATYWSSDTVKGHDGQIVQHIASDQLWAAGVSTGDTVFVISYLRGTLYVVTSIVVDQLVRQDRAEEILGRSNLWPADWHAIAKPDPVWPASLSASLSESQMASLKFIGRDGQASAPARNRHGEIDPQTFRTTRRIDARSAKLLSDLLAKRK
jgi:hypothetical protein